MDDLIDPQQSNIKLLNLSQLNPKPRPIAGMCNPLCPYFVCGKDSLQVLTINKRGVSTSKPFCLIIGSECTGLKCRYSRCKLLVAGVDGRCLAVVARSQRA